MQATGQASTQSATPSHTSVTMVWAMAQKSPNGRRSEQILGTNPVQPRTAAELGKGFASGLIGDWITE